MQLKELSLNCVININKVSPNNASLKWLLLDYDRIKINLTTLSYDLELFVKLNTKNNDVIMDSNKRMRVSIKHFNTDCNFIIKWNYFDFELNNFCKYINIQ